EKGHNSHKFHAISNLKYISENQALKNDIAQSTLKFEEFKIELAEEQHKDMLIQKDNFKISLLGKNYVKNDMKFEWINKDNILNVYKNFVETAQANKDSYSR